MQVAIVSIPQSGFGAFELEDPWGGAVVGWGFQSLSRDSGRLNLLCRWLWWRL